MKANIAVVTVSGKAYYLIVNELQKRKIPFISLIPGETIPIETKVVVTTEKEKHLIKHERVLLYKDGANSETMINNVLQSIQGKKYYTKIVIGIDPGEVIGLAVLADGKVIQTENCSSVEETLERVKNIAQDFEIKPITAISVKIGDGVPAYKAKLLQALDNLLPQNVTLESVSEFGTSRYLNQAKHRRELKDMLSATRIAGRNGHKFQRRKVYESNS